ncbi:MAG: hypothetical protein KME21_01495 [Desmonostoc vinosum HA7617-LM4]|jgi:hypothetical protein|nr:hypothetical protein [Desmonostoc vinosum HA7617-LM4]
MLQAASTSLIVLEPADDLIANESWSIDVYADGLMDELFADIDHILDGSRNLASQTVRQSNRLKSGHSPTSLPPEYIPLQTVTVPQIVLPKTQRTVKPVSGMRNRQLGTVVTGNPKQQRTRRILGKLLIVGTTLGVAIAGIIGLVQSGVIHLLNTKLTHSALQVTQSQVSTRAEVNAELVDYMLGSLAAIDKQEGQNNRSYIAKSGFSRETTTTQTPPASNQFTGNLPPLPPLAANYTSPAAKNSASVVERIYIPVYQAPSPMRYALPSIPGNSTPLPPVATAVPGTQPDIVKTTLNTVRKAAKPVTVNMLAAAVRSELKPVDVRTAPIAVKQTPNPLPALPVLPLRPTTPEAPTATQQQVYLPNTVADTAPSHTLEGLLELGNKSAALFKIDGVSRRVDVGESIGSSGWTLVEVSRGEAIVRRNGEVRSIYAGQKL